MLGGDESIKSAILDEHPCVRVGNAVTFKGSLDVLGRNDLYRVFGLGYRQHVRLEARGADVLLDRQLFQGVLCVVVGLKV